MLRDIFKNKWILGGIALLIIIAGGCYFYYQYTIAQYEKQAAETAEFARQWKINQESKTKNEVERTSNNRQDDASPQTLAEEQEETKKLTHTDIMNLSLEQRKSIFNSFYTQHGLKPPPRGYMYLWESPGIPLLDENGKPILHKRHEPIVKLKTAKAFSPTAEEYEMLKALDIEAGSQRVLGNTAKAEQLESEYNQLYSEVMRERPVAGRTIWVAPKSKKESDPDKPDRMMKEKLRSALIDQGFSDLIPILEEIGEL